MRYIVTEPYSGTSRDSYNEYDDNHRLTPKSLGLLRDNGYDPRVTTYGKGGMTRTYWEVEVKDLEDLERMSRLFDCQLVVGECDTLIDGYPSIVIYNYYLE